MLQLFTVHADDSRFNTEGSGLLCLLVPASKDLVFQLD